MAGTGNVVQQAGAIAVRNPGAPGATPEILLVRSKKNPSHWIFPKGHVEKDETEEAASVRELLEEGGIEGSIISRAGRCEHSLDGVRYGVTYYLLRYISTQSGGEPGREPSWCTVEEALRRLSFPDLKKMLRTVFPD